MREIGHAIVCRESDGGATGGGGGGGSWWDTISNLFGSSGGSATATGEPGFSGKAGVDLSNATDAGASAGTPLVSVTSATLPGPGGVNPNISAFDIGGGLSPQSSLTSGGAEAPIGVNTGAVGSPTTANGFVSGPLGDIPASASGEVTGAADSDLTRKLQALNIPGSGGAADKSWFSNLVDSSGDALGKNPVGAAVAGAGLGLNLLRGNSPLQGQNETSQIGKDALAQSAKLSSYLENGTLPPGAQQGLDQAKASAAAAIRSKYAQMGMSGSTAEVQELGALDQRVAAQGFQYAMDLLNKGIQSSGIATNVFNNLMGINQKENEATQGAIGDFATALAGGSNIRLSR